MKHPLFKDPADSLSQQEEDLIARQLAEAYRQHEVTGNDEEIRRIALAVEEIMRKMESDKDTGHEPKGSRSHAAR